MATQQRIYVVARVAGNDREPVHQRLVRAPNAAQAVRHVAQDILRVAVPTQDELVALVAAGVKVEDSGRAAEDAPA